MSFPNPLRNIKSKFNNAGVADKFSKSEIEQPDPSALYKTELCNTFQEQGSCRYGFKCRFAHGHADLRPVQRHKKYKTEMCHNYSTTGHCPYESRCRFIHERDEELSNPFVLRDESSSQNTRGRGRSHRRARSASLYLMREQRPVRDTGSAAHSLISLSSADWQPTEEFLPQLEVLDNIDNDFHSSVEAGEELELSETIDHVVKVALDSPPNEVHAVSRTRQSEPDLAGYGTWNNRRDRLVLSPRRGEGRMRIDLSPRRGEGRLYAAKRNSKSATSYNNGDVWGQLSSPRIQSHSLNNLKSKKLVTYATLPPRFFDSMDRMEDGRRSMELENRRSGSLSYEYASSTDISPASSAASSGVSDNHSFLYNRSASGETDIEQQLNSLSLKKSLFAPPAPQRPAPVAYQTTLHNRSATLPFINAEDMGNAPPTWQLWNEQK